MAVKSNNKKVTMPKTIKIDTPNTEIPATPEIILLDDYPTFHIRVYWAVIVETACRIECV